MSLAIPVPRSPDEDVEAALASLTEADIPPDDADRAWASLDAGRPVELMGVADADLAGLLAEPPPRPAALSWPLCYRAADGPWPAGFDRRDGTGGGAGFADGGPLDVLPAGLALAGFAAETRPLLDDPQLLDDDSLIGVLRAWRRLTSWAQAGEFAALAALGRRRPADGTPPAAEPGGFPERLSEFVAAEVAAALTLTSRAAETQLGLALDLAARPATAAALEAGEIDLPRARLFTDLLGPLDPDHAAAVEAAVLPLAPAMTTGQLRAALARAILAVDPDAARRRREQAERAARVEHWADPEGTASLAGRNLPPAQVLAASARLTRIARAWKNQGAAGGMDLLRAHAYLALLNGLDVTTPPASLLSTPGEPPSGSQPETTPSSLARHGAPGTSATGRDRTSADSQTMGTQTDVDAQATGRPEPGTRGADADARPETGTRGSADAGPERGTRGGADAGPATSSTGRPPPGSKPTAAPGHGAELIPGPQPVPAGLRRPGSDELPPLTGQVSLTVPLTTLLGAASGPGDIPGYGPVDADTARQLACALAGHRATRWHIIITGPDGTALATGTHRGPPRVSTNPPCGTGAPSAGPPRGAPGEHGAGPDQSADGQFTPAGGWTVRVTAEPIAGITCDHRNAEPGYRPSPGLQRLIRARSTTCTGPSCRRPARRCDLDHTLPHDDGGLTCECNLAPLCRSCHRLKQAQHWRLHQPAPGVMIWITPAGRTYLTLPSQHLSQ